MGSQHVSRDGLIRVTQQKTGAEVALPIRPELQEILDAVPRTGDLSFLFAANGSGSTKALTTRNGAGGATKPTCRARASRMD
jgi:hypothetical protein